MAESSIGTTDKPKSKLGTWYADRPRWQAVLIFAAFVGLTAWGLVIATRDATVAAEPVSGPRDLYLYEAVVARVHAGESYYDAARQELPTRGYSTGSLFNWRTPTYAWLYGKLPSPRWGQFLLVAGCLLTMLLAYGLASRSAAVGLGMLLMLLLFGAFELSVDDLFARDATPAKAFLATELWAGMLIALSVCLYANNRWPLAGLAGLLALFFRELALPYCVICLGLAVFEKRWREVGVWLAGLVLYGAFLTWHAAEVARQVQILNAAAEASTPDQARASDWIQFGGLTMVLGTAQMNFFLIKAPIWVTALYLPLALLGLAGWRGPTGRRLGLTVAAYVAAFAIVGKHPFNNYWGILYAPLLAFGAVWGFFALRDLWRSVFVDRAVPRPI